MIAIGTYIGKKVGKSWSSYWTRRKILDYSSRSGNSFLETGSGSNLNARLLSPVFVGNGSGYYEATNKRYFSTDDWVFYIDLELFGTPGTETIFAQSYNNVYFQIQNASSKWQFNMKDAVNNRNISIAYATLPIAARKYSFKFVHDKDGSTTIYESGIQVGTASGTFTNVAASDHTYYGSGTGALMSSNVAIISSRVYSDLTETTLVASYIFQGAGTYDVSGNNNNLTSKSIVAANKKYSLNGSLYCLDSGWTLWQKAASADIRVPSGCTTSPIAVGYLATKDYVGSLTGINMADCLVGFNETGSADTKLEIFDRSNTTRQEDASRTSTYYDATSLATKSRYHISEVYPYEAFIALFKTDYKNFAFPNISKASTDFSVTQVTVYDTQASGSGLAYLKTLNHLDSKYTVGSDKNFKIIQRAIDYSYDDYTLTIDAGTWLESLDLTVKKVNITGSGNLGTIIYHAIEAQSTVSAVNVGKNCIFNNIVIDKRELFAGLAKPIVNISGCNPTFTNCQIGRDVYDDGYNSQNAFNIDTGSIVTMTGCSVKGTTSIGTTPYLSYIKDTSKLIFEGTSMFACILMSDTSELDLDVDYLYVDDSSSNNPGITAGGDTIATVRINTREISWDLATRAEDAAGVFSVSSYRLSGNANFTLSGNQITGSVRITGAGVICLLKDIVSTLGRCWMETSGAATTALITYDNCQITADFNNDVSGGHIIEEDAGAEVRLINGTVLTFSGHQGTWLSMGNPVVMVGKLYMRNSTVIDNVNDNIPFGANYEATLLLNNEFDIEDSVITNQNWDTVGSNRNIQLQDGVLNCRLKNVTLNNSEVNSPCIFFGNDTDLLDVNDYICVDNVVFNSTGGEFGASAGSDIAGAWAALKAACPV